MHSESPEQPIAGARALLSVYPEIRIEMEVSGFNALVRRAQGGDRKAMDEVLEILRPRLEQMARPYADPVRPVQSTTDLLQESCLRAWNRIETFQGADNDEETFAMFRSWIGQIVQRIGLDERKARDRKRRIPPKKIVSLERARPDKETSPAARVDLPGREETPSVNVRSREAAEKIRASLKAIRNESDATILRLYFFEGLSLRQISQRTGASYDKVKERYWATLRGLRRDLEGHI